MTNEEIIEKIRTTLAEEFEIDVEQIQPNLPDKEFRYLRTVIVTAAVYRGFNSRLLLTDDLSS